MHKTSFSQNSLYPYAHVSKIWMFFLCIIGAILNLVFNTMNLLWLDLPLYLDTIMTVSFTFLAGPVYGALTGAFTNIIANTIDLDYWGWEGYLFALCNIATAIITWLFIRFFPCEIKLGQETGAGFQKSAVNFPYRSLNSRRLDAVMSCLIVLILLSFALCLAMSILGGLIAAFIQFIRSVVEYELYNPSAARLGSTLFPEGLPVFLVQILSRIPVNIIDRLITTFAGYGIALGVVNLLHLLSKKKQRKT